eukprot:jgi/Botrbrau1/2133/Bobra.0093s0040.1
MAVFEVILRILLDSSLLINSPDVDVKGRLVSCLDGPQAGHFGGYHMLQPALKSFQEISWEVLMQVILNLEGHLGSHLAGYIMGFMATMRGILWVILVVLILGVHVANLMPLILWVI